MFDRNIIKKFEEIVGPLREGIVFNYAEGIYEAKELEDDDAFYLEYCQKVADDLNNIVNAYVIGFRQGVASATDSKKDLVVLVKNKTSESWQERYVSHMSSTSKGIYCYPDGLKSSQSKDVVYWDEWKPIQ